jgi:hypothetical protein
VRQGNFKSIHQPSIPRRRNKMPDTKQEAVAASKPRVSLDVWAVLLALTLVALVRFGVLPSVGW